MGNLVDAFASSLFFRILLPGLVLTGGLSPFLEAAVVEPTMVALLPIGSSELPILYIAFFGLLAYSATILVYHIVHGVRAPILTSLSSRYTEWRVRKQARCLQRLYGEKSFEELPEAVRRQVRHVHHYLRDFVLEQAEDGFPEYQVGSRTRLGCIIDRYTFYPETRYGIDSNFYAERINYLFPPEVRKSLDGTEAVAQGMVLTAASCWALLIMSTNAIVLNLADSLIPSFIPRLPSPTVASLMVLLGLATAGLILFNLLAREAHRDYGRTFEAAFDVWADDIRKWIDRRVIPFPAETKATATRFAVVAMHLQEPSSPRAQDTGSRDDDAG